MRSPNSPWIHWVDIKWYKTPWLFGALEHEWIMTFHSVGNFMIPTNSIIFQRARSTTNQIISPLYTHYSEDVRFNPASSKAEPSSHWAPRGRAASCTALAMTPEVGDFVSPGILNKLGMWSSNWSCIFNVYIYICIYIILYRWIVVSNGWKWLLIVVNYHDLTVLPHWNPY